MPRHSVRYYASYWASDISAGIVLFFVALPLCLGIALAMGAPPFAGLLGGAIGGLIVCVLSGSQLSVSGPANGVAVASAAAIASHGYSGFLVAVLIAGALQILLGLLRAGSISAYLPSAVLKGVLSAIGIMLILKQIPHALGNNFDPQEDFTFLDQGGAADFSPLRMLDGVSPGPLILAVSSLAILLFWDTAGARKFPRLAAVPGAFVIVVYGVLFNFFTRTFFPNIALATEHLVSLPSFHEGNQFWREMAFPDFSQLTDLGILQTALGLAAIMSLESLLTLEAAEKLDPLKRTVSGDRELIAQGVGNFLSGLVGGTPISAVIVRTSVNINAGAHTKTSSFTHGLLLLASVFFLAPLLNSIPLASLATILIHTGYKLTKPALYLDVYGRGRSQFIPFAVTIFFALTLDLVKGVGIGLVVGLLFVMRNNYHSALTLTRHENSYLLRLRKDVSFLNKAPLRELLDSVNEGASLLVDGTRADYVDIEILETFEDFQKSAPEKGITVEFKNVRGFSASRAYGDATEKVSAH